ncbi:V-type ATPase, V0 complex, 116kDa subunit family [Phakopsora pachyrhizi]|uniref:V-type proton ATPase subunit a n=1 Tax=Phakopsora pachyrhizi TaxID=170000 RepID=A0AAV0AUP9_PHAPC|nr:V-type ATPase, V0 complex, 116kDa subunit family [Phakopsora pachyrhizi]CAH7672200.1 V-type ATPase, V0 complex, 116kDa subunit family [Phakopsora pachyrhizi]
MTNLLRSESMSLVQVFIPTDVAHPVVAELGELGRVQFKDLNSEVNPFQRTYVAEIRRLDEMTRRLNLFSSLLEAENINPLSLNTSSSAHLLAPTAGSNYATLLDSLDSELADHEIRLQTMNSSYDTLRKRFGELEEAQHVLRETAVFFERSNSGGIDSREERTLRNSFDDDRAGLLDNAAEEGRIDQFGEGGGGVGGGAFELEFVSGTIDRARMPTFERVLWRVLRGNLYLNWAEIDQPLTSSTAALPASASQADQAKAKAIRKVVFIIFAHGDELLSKIRKIAESMGANVVPVDPNSSIRENSLRDLNSRIEDITSVLYNTNETRRNALKGVAQSLAGWWAVVRKEKRIYATLNLFQYDKGGTTLIAEGWVPTRDITTVQRALQSATEKAGTTAPSILHELRTTAKPPTFHRTNRFTEGFQAIVDAYGIASYQEINPALFTIITFPFLFAVMFGDIGHGLIMFLSALAMVMYEKKLSKVKDEIFSMFFFGRYIILLMGAFAVFTGFMYNDIFSLSLTLAKSAWKWPEHITNGTMTAELTDNRYPFGLDPNWHGAENNLIFTNSLKMKMSIILGVIHMSFAICLQVPNHLFFGRKSSIWAEFLPQILFMESIFGYLVLTIVYKWSIDWSKPGAGNPPNLLNMLIYMFLSPGTVNPEEQLYSGQAFIQVFLLLLALVCIPWMLCVKPYLEYKEHQKILGQGYGRVSNTAGGREELRRSSYEADEEEAGHVAVHHDDDEHGFDMGDIIIHQSIHTIEFALGCISNTASYLRLWALSLAHAQLSEVLWSMTIKLAFGVEGLTGIIMTVIMFAMWFALTVAILILMEGLSAFLHALRLHWVESNGKHYEGAGYQFEPLDFIGIDEGYE